ncbi:MAG TPA: cellulase family glycosylhydrolase, partial [Candidatus Dormibacteraeota bacterium]|nr:cellulase family glycosylhydrolase [Candidatus Dormibacteraeota bacterium]
SWRKHLSPAVNAATTYFWLSPDWQDDFQAVWRAVAARFRDNSGVAGYDIYNEPHPLPIPPRLFEEHWMWPLYARSITSIGSVDPNHLFIVEGTLFGNFGTTIVHLEAPQLVYSPHLYTGSLVPPDFNGDRGPLTDKLRDEAAEAAAVPAAFWSGELGIDRTKPQAAGWADAALDAYDDLGVGWAWWQWRESRSWGVRDENGIIDTAFLRHLARPYVRAAPSGVRGGRGDGMKGTLRIDVDANHGDAEVDIAWPGMTLPAPALTGSCVTASSWSADTATLSITLASGRGCAIQLTTTPA